MPRMVQCDLHDYLASSSKSDNKISLNENEVYVKIKHLGDGSFSTVSLYRKLNRQSGETKLVALKKLSIESMTSEENIKQIEQAINEVKILSILKHENIITYYGSFTKSNRFYIETEYADGGTLADFLASLPNSLEEIEILALFVQIVSAVLYLHQRNIIHRDIKTTNIFLNTQGFIKIGDFGISKILDSKLDARSFVGTPFYICPEIFEGKTYNKPCDIWSLGCVLYEMASLHKTFEANNLSTLMQKIIKATYMPVNNKYSKRFHKLVHGLLQKNPLKRINSEELIEKVNFMINKLTPLESTIWNGSTIKDIRASESLREYIKKKRSLHRPTAMSASFCTVNTIRCSHLYCLDIFSPNLNLSPIPFPHRIHLKQLSKGENHLLALTVDNRIYSWGIGATGELGLGKQIQQATSPCLVESLRKYSIQKIAAGHRFSVFVTKNGLVLTCGSYRTNCLAHKEAEDLYEPKLVNSLFKVNIFDVSCGTNHVLAISSDGVAYSWGSNQHGKLGIADSCQVALEPTKVVVSNNVKFKKGFCGSDSTALIDYMDNLWLCGNNKHNKLALNRISLFGSHLVQCALAPQRARLPQKYKTNQLAFGSGHTLFFQENGKILAAGCNQSGQLGQQHVKPVEQATWCSTPRHHKIKAIAAGSNFSLAFTNSSIFFWGTRTVKSECEEYQQQQQTETSTEFIIGRCNESLMDLVQANGPDYPIIKITEPKLVVSKISGLADVLNSKDSIILSPQSILELYSPKTLQTGEMNLSEIYCFEDDSIFVVVDSVLTTSNSPSTIQRHIPHEEKSSKNIASIGSNLPTGSETITKHSYAWVNDD